MTFACDLSMKTNRPHRLAVVLLLAGFALAGCRNTQSSSPAPHAPAGPTYEGYHRPRNPYFLPKPILALESPEMHRLASAAETGGNPQTDRWYDGRNDWQPTTSSGYRTSTLEAVATQTYDRLYQSGGHIRDHYSQWTRRGSYSETVR